MSQNGTSTSPARKAKVPAAPRKISRVAATRVFYKLGKRRQPVTLTLGVPEPLPGWDWACAVQITGLDRWRSRPRFMFGIDGLQALHLAIHYAKSTLETSGHKLEWLGQSDDLGFPPRLLPYLPKRERQRIERMVEREVRRVYAAAERRAAKGKKGATRQ